MVVRRRAVVAAAEVDSSCRQVRKTGVELLGCVQQRRSSKAQACCRQVISQLVLAQPAGFLQLWSTALVPTLQRRPPGLRTHLKVYPPGSSQAVDLVG
jgi:hypothetical protein